ncbi:hypothetical protein ABPG74_003562 [Tetrahymena malaccensis]
METQTENQIDAQEYLRMADALLQNKQKDEALILCDKAIQLNLQYPQAYLKKGILLKDLDKKIEASECFQKAFKLDSENIEILKNIVQLNNSQEKYDESMQLSNQLIQNNPQNFIGYYLKGSTLMKTLSYDEALLNIDKSIELNPDQFNAYNIKAFILSKQGKTKEAVQFYDKAISLKPDCELSYRNKILELNKLGQKQQSLKCYDKLLELNPTSASNYIKKGKLLIDLKLFQEADLCFKNAIELDANDTDAYIQKGILNYEQKQYDESLESYYRALEINPYLSEAYLQIAVLLKSQKKYQEALEQIRKALDIDVKYYQAFNQKGQLLQLLGQEAEALQCFEKAIELNPKYKLALNNKAKLLEQLNQKSEALNCFKYIQEEIEPSSVHIIQKIADLSFDLGLFDQSLKYYSKVLEINPSLFNVYIKKSQILSQMGQINEALECVDRAIQINPNSHQGYLQKGLLLKQDNQFEQALKNFDLTLEIYQKNYEANFYKGQILNNQGKLQEALNCFHFIIQTWPNIDQGHSHLGVVLRKLNQHDESLIFLDNAIRINPKNELSYLNKGLVYFQKNLKKEALELFNKTIELNPTNHEAYFCKALVYYKLQQQQEAMQQVNKAIELNQQYYEAYILKGEFLNSQQSYDQAQDIFGQAIKIDSKSHKGYLGIGKCLFYKKKYNEAQEYFNKTIQINSKCYESFNFQGAIFIDLKKTNEALECLNQSISLNENYSLSYANRARLYLQINNFESAIQDSKKIANIFQQNKIDQIQSQKNFEQQFSQQMQNFIKLLNSVDQKANRDKIQENKVVRLKQVALQIKDLVNQKVQYYQMYEILKLMCQLDENNKQSLQLIDQKNIQLDQDINNLLKQFKSFKLSFLQDQAINNLDQFILLFVQTFQHKQQKISNNQKSENVQNKLDNLGQMMHTKQVVDKNIQNQLNLNQDLLALKNEGRNIFDYYQTFYWTTLNMFLTYTVIQNKIIQNQQYLKVSELILKNKHFINQETKSGLEQGQNNFQGMNKPLINLNFFELINDVVQQITDSCQNQKEKKGKINYLNRIKAISQFIQGKCNLDKDLSLKLAQASINLTKFRKNFIKYPNPIYENNQIYKSIKEKVAKIQNDIFQKEELKSQNSKSVQLAFQDAILLISYICIYNQELTEIQDDIPKIFVDLIENNRTEALLQQSQLRNLNSKEESEKCAIF